MSRFRMHLHEARNVRQHGGHKSGRARTQMVEYLRKRGGPQKALLLLSSDHLLRRRTPLTLVAYIGELCCKKIDLPGPEGKPLSHFCG